MNSPRMSGILLHPTSLPGPGSIGDLGPAATAFVDFLVAAGQQLWQVMPLGPTGYGDSPYQGLSAFAGNPLLISPDRLLADGWIDSLEGEAALEDVAQVDYAQAQDSKRHLVQRAFRHFQATAADRRQTAFAAFRTRHAAWLDDYSLFASLKEAHAGAAWNTWPPDLAAHDPAALARWRHEHDDNITLHAFAQFLFFSQWADLKQYAQGQGVQLVGDLPIFVAYDSADVWAERAIFQVKADGQLQVVAGAPPDLFDSRGQRWGNVLYRWDVLADTGYDWWVRRLRTLLTLVDWVRLDHFRGFAAYWEVPAADETAEHGTWVPGPGRALFTALEAALGPLPLIAEDLGFITPDVIELRDTLGFPSMTVLQMAWNTDPANPHLPHNYRPHTVVYSSTHDTNTTAGWWATATPTERFHVQMYLGRDGHDISWDMIRLALSSVATWAIVPLQDVLDLGGTARMNTPGQGVGNWGWRITPGPLDRAAAARLRHLTALYGRLPAPPP